MNEVNLFSCQAAPSPPLHVVREGNTEWLVSFVLPTLGLALWLAAAGCGAGSDSPPLPRLHADSTRIVNADGETVVLKGVNLGGWLFNETWITQIDYSLTSRLHLLGVREGIGAEVDALLAEGSPVWRSDSFIDEFEPRLAARVGTEKAAAFAALARTYQPALCDDADLPMRRKLSERFGDAVRDELLDTFQRAWLNRDDIVWLAAHGFNVVRVPMTYRSLTTGPDLDQPSGLVWNEAAFRRLDALLGWCEAEGVYAILDIQEAPGAQNDYAGPARLYADPAMQQLTVQLWEELSRRYRDRDVVAAYSLLAEPMGAPDTAARDAMYDRLVKAIRALGDDHLLVIHDGFFGMKTLPDPAEFGWTGVVYSTHLFEWDADEYADWEFLVDFYHEPIFTAAQTAQGVPYYIGSFSTRRHADWAYRAAGMLVDWYASHGWSWSVWTYKRIDDPIEKQIWDRESSYGLIGRLTGEFDRPDLYDDDLETLRRKFAAYADLPIEPNPELLRALTGTVRSRSDSRTGPSAGGKR